MCEEFYYMADYQQKRDREMEDKTKEYPQCTALDIASYLTVFAVSVAVVVVGAILMWK